MIFVISVFGLSFVATSAQATQPKTNSGVCGPLDSGKKDITVDNYYVHMIMEPELPDGMLVTGYCVKAGSDKQEDGGPEYVTVDPALPQVGISHSTGKSISHYSFSYAPAEDVPNDNGPFVPQVPTQYVLPTVVCSDTDLRGEIVPSEQAPGVTVQTTGMSEAGWISVFSVSPPNTFENGESTITKTIPYYGSLCETSQPPVVEEPVEPETPAIPNEPVNEPKVETPEDGYPAPEAVVNTPVVEQPVAENKTATTVQEPVKRNEGLNIQSSAKQDLPDQLAYTGVNAGMLVAALILLALGSIAVVSAWRRK